MRTPKFDYQLYTVPLQDGRRLIAEPPLDVVVGREGGLYVAKVPALTGDRPSFGKSVDLMHIDLCHDIDAAWCLYSEEDINKLAPDAIEFRDTLLKAFRVERISIVHPTPDSAEFTVDGIVYSVKRETVRNGIQMLIVEDAFYERFGRGDDEWPLIRASFKANDNRIKGET